MGCHRLVDEEGRVTGFLCSGRTRRKRCREGDCRRDSQRLCDFPMRRKGKLTTCSKPICLLHATVKGPDIDYCQEHKDQKPQA